MIVVSALAMTVWGAAILLGSLFELAGMWRLSIGIGPDPLSGWGIVLLWPVAAATLVIGIRTLQRHRMGPAVAVSLGWLAVAAVDIVANARWALVPTAVVLVALSLSAAHQERSTRRFDR